MRPSTRALALAAVLLGTALLSSAPSAMQSQHDLSKEKVLYCVGYAHLDTQWRWDYTTTIDDYLKATLDDNFERFERFPQYVFNFTGSRRYALMKEYFPERWKRLKQYVAQGRWFVSGSSVDEGDVNTPSVESVIRQVLYGNEFFREEFGKESVDYMLPDCFGFDAAMPSVFAHCGLLGFSTQKLPWGSAVGIPFGIGRWIGPDGRGIVAGLNPGSYASAIKGRVDLNQDWSKRIEDNGKNYGVYADFHYYGVGDMGGAPRERDVANYVASVDNPDSLFHVELGSSDRLFRDLTDDQKARLPEYRGDLLLTQHSAGSITSEAYMKRWNRKNEQLADAAERAAVAAQWLGGQDYPGDTLRRSWLRVLGSQMHDMLPGTCIPRAYHYTWNDEILGLNGFASVLGASTGAVSRALDTQVEGIPLIVYNPLAIERQDPVEASVTFEDEAPAAVSVLDSEGNPVPAQVLSREGSTLHLLVLPTVAPISWTVLDVRAADAAPADQGGLKVDEHSLENQYVRVTLDANGDVASIVDKTAGGRELLSAPARLVFTHERPEQWPAWNMDWKDRQKPPIGYVDGPAKIKVVESGPVRVAIEIQRQARDSFFTQTVRLSRGTAGQRVEFENHIDWQATECALRASFPLTVANDVATYNLGLGTIERGNNDPKKYEVPSHEWFDLTDRSGDYGVSVLDDCKIASDKPSDGEVRLTLLYTPGVRDGYLDQHSQDWGRHDILYALYGHAGDWRDGKSEWQGRRVNQPLRVFQAPRHAGTLGRALSLVSVSTPQVDVRALKQAEQSDEVIVRLQELFGRPAKDVTVAFPSNVLAAHEVDGQERPIGPATVRDGKLVADFDPFHPRAFALRLAPPAQTLAPPHATPVELAYDVDVASNDSDRTDGAFDGEGRSYPAELLPPTLVDQGIAYRLGPMKNGATNAVACKGQAIALPAGDYDRVYLLAAADEDVDGTFTLGGDAQTRKIEAWTGIIGQWDNRVWDSRFGKVDYHGAGHVVRIDAGFIKRVPVAWFATHRHSPTAGNEAYQFTYLFAYALDRPADAKELVLPDDPRIKVFAVSVGPRTNDGLRLAAPLYDDFDGRGPIALRHVYPPPPKPVFEGVAPAGKVVVDRQARWEDLSMGPPAADDFADVHSGNGVVFRYFEGDGDWAPHPGSGAVDGTFPRLNDGEVAQNFDDTSHCVWYDNEGRFGCDLGASHRLRAIHTYSWHRSDRAPQFFSLWASNADEMPSPDFQNGGNDGWTLLGVVNSKSLGEGGKHGSAVLPPDGSDALGPYRWLLWVAEDVGQGTFFTEIDVLTANDD